jgi:hypothetical protein
VLRLTVAIGALAAYAVTLAVARDLAIWLYANYGWLAVMPLFISIFWLGIVMEKAEQRRLGIKRPLFSFRETPPGA